MSGKYIGHMVKDKPLTFETQSGEAIDIGEVVYLGGIDSLSPAERFSLWVALRQLTCIVNGKLGD